MTERNILVLFIAIVSFCFLVPGVTLSMMTISSGGLVKATEPVTTELKLNFFKTSNSILKTVDDLFHKDNKFVACMIFLFSVITPVIKGILLLIILFSKNTVYQKKLFSFIKGIGKWSMCDVFIVATFLAYFSTNSRATGNHYEGTILGAPVDVNLIYKMNAHLEIGFYCFLTYCMLSLIAIQIYRLPEKNNSQC